MSARRFGRALGQLFRASQRFGESVRPDVRPGCEFGLVVDERLKDLREELAGIRNLLRALLLAVVAGVIGLVADLVVRGVCR